ncbi:MAG: glycosyltransferase family 2 protein [Clostridia bacterium]|nr:glycosyltransferase family 2 protein [Clostridia bacterium]MBQ7289139.1 glycosyltransferase family 2 protein [Clostridia bacterium]
MQKNDILVSVICTTYNHQKFIQSALDGFVMQKTNFSFEVLVHDDASPDGTAQIIREYAEKYPDIIVPILQTENQYSKGVLILNDILYPKARGKYIAFCEGDDFWTDENKLQMQVDFLEKNPDCTACVHNTVMHDCSGFAKDELMVQNTSEHDVAFEDVIWGMRNAYQTSSLVVKKEALFNVPSFCQNAYKAGFGDFPNAIWFTIMGKIHFLPYTMSTYRLMSSANSWSADSFTITKQIKHTNHMIDMFEDIKPHVSDERVSLLDKAILSQKFRLLEFKKEYDKMRKPPYDKIWRAQPLMFKIKIYIKKLCPWLYKKFKRLGD